MSKESVVSKLSDSVTFGFNEIRLDPQNVELFAQDSTLKNTIDLFCFGTYSDYLTYRSDFINLNDQAIYKLKQLTIVTESLENNFFTFDYLNSQIGGLPLEQFERLIVDSIYSKIIDAKIFSKEQNITIRASIGRDVLLEGESIPKYGKNIKTLKQLIQGLEQFNEKIGSAFQYLNDVKSSVEDKEVLDLGTKQGASVISPSSRKRKK